jgi:hypothetical protein
MEPNKIPLLLLFKEEIDLEPIVVLERRKRSSHMASAVEKLEQSGKLESTKNTTTMAWTFVLPWGLGLDRLEVLVPSNCTGGNPQFIAKTSLCIVLRALFFM